MYSPPPLATVICQTLQEESQHSDDLPESPCLEPNMVSEQPEFPAQLLQDTDPIQRVENGVISVKNGTEPSAKAPEDEISRLLQVIKSCGYRLVKDDSPERGRKRERTVDVKKREKRESVGCNQCGFIGRPCELRYITITGVMGRCS
jgi:hypothetical protein